LWVRTRTEKEGGGTGRGTEGGREGGERVRGRERVTCLVETFQGGLLGRLLQE
jgi:hypothetical protein